VALLRAINVGGHVVKMDQLRKLFEALAFTNVETFIASGNVVFDAPRGAAAGLERSIEAHLKKALGYEVTTFLRSSEEILSIVDRPPFADQDLSGAAIYVLFLKERVTTSGTKALRAMRSDLDDFDASGREVYWLRRKYKERAGEPPPPFERVLSSPATSRNITTVRRLADRFCR
jgi:uncharacterized protein (DUF1697 family)